MGSTDVRSIKRISVVLFITMLCIETICSQWEQLNGPTTGYMLKLFTDGENIYASSRLNGLYKSTNSGGTWSRIENGLPKIAYSSFIKSGENYYALGNGDLYISITGGENWSLMNKENPGLRHRTLAVLNDILFAAEEGGDFYLSANHGCTWITYNNELDTVLVNQFIVNGSKIYAATNCGVFVSSNEGVSWKLLNTGLTEKNINVLLISGGIIYAGTPKGVFRSTDTGVNWSSVNNGLNNLNVIDLAQKGNKIFAGTQNDGVYVSANNGLKWIITSSVMKNQNTQSICIKENIILVSTSNGIMCSTDDGTSWQQINYGFDFTPVNSMAEINGRVFVETDEAVLYRTDNSGNGWQRIQSEPLTTIGKINSISQNGNKILAAGQGIASSTNEGATWIFLEEGLYPYIISAMASTEKVIYALQNNGVLYRSTNSGVSWDGLNTGISLLYVFPICIDGNNIGIMSYYKNLLVSSNLGDNWIQVDLGFSYWSNYSMAIKDGKLYIGSANGLYISADFGKTWKHPNNQFYNNDNFSIVTFGNSILASVKGPFIDGGVYLSTDDGVTWSKRSLGLNDIIPTSLVAGSNYILAKTSNSGVWRRKISELITGLNEETQEKGFCCELMQNYPNPFNPLTSIKYSISQESKVTLAVFNTLGQRVKELVNEVKPAGVYITTLNGAEFPSGIYFYQLTAGSFSQTKKLILLK